MNKKWKFNEDYTRVIYNDDEAYKQSQEFTAHTEDHLNTIERNEFLIKVMLSLHEINSCLDAGCREGLTLDVLKRHGITMVKGVDISEVSIEYAKTKGRDVCVGDMHKLQDIFDVKFDSILSVHSLEHCHTPETVFIECYNLLNDDGLLAIRVPIQRNLTDQPYKIAVDKKVDIDDPAGLPAHASIFSVDSLRKLFEDSGFKVVYEKGHRVGDLRYEECSMIGKKV